MPELPEVETIRQDLNRLVVGKKILVVKVLSPKSFVGDPQKIIGKKIVAVKRRAKLLIIELTDTSEESDVPSASSADSTLPPSEVLLIHLKLTGRLLVRKQTEPPDDWQRVVFKLSDGLELRFCDLRKFGWIKIMQNELKNFGPEPFSREFTTDYLRKVFSQTSRPVKLVLMDQKKIAGVGNIYANEALFLAKIRPDRPAKKLSNKEIERLRSSLLKVLKAGIKYRGASDQYYLDALGRKGSYQDHFLVYQREGRKCFHCGAKIKRIKLAGRGTFYCPKCQS